MHVLRGWRGLRPAAEAHIVGHIALEKGPHMRSLIAASVLPVLLAAAARAQAPVQLPLEARVRIQLVGATDSLLEGTVKQSTEGCTLIAFDSGVSVRGGTVASLASIARLWLATDSAGSPWHLMSMDRLRAAEPPGCPLPH